jgi:hypothetical protein
MFNYSGTTWQKRGGSSLQKQLDALRRAGHINIEGTTFQQGPFGTNIEIIPQASTGSTAQIGQVRLFVVTDNDGTPPGSSGLLAGDTLTSGSIAVARPPRLRRSDWDGKTINGITYTYTNANERTAVGVVDEGTDDEVTVTENQVIVPPYLDIGGLNEYYGDPYIIFAVRAEDTGLSYTTSDPDAGGSKTVKVVWQDVNADGRAWAVVSGSI